jgi:lipoprotein-releasing system permease protein
MRFELFIAARYLRAKRRQAFIGIITGISIVGVAAGVASLIVALAINNGFRQDLQERLHRLHLAHQPAAHRRRWHQRLAAALDRLSQQPHVVAAAPAIFEQVLISRGPRARGAVLKGMIPSYERKVGDLLNTMKEGSAAALDEAIAQPEKDHAETGRLACLQQGTPATEESPDSLAAVHARIAAMPPSSSAKTWPIIWARPSATVSW